MQHRAPSRRLGRRWSLVVALAAALLAACAPGHAAAQTCGNQWIGVWEGKLRVSQQYPVPQLSVALDYLTYWTYTKITILPDADTFTQVIVGQTTADTLTCEYTCHNEKPVGRQGAIEIQVVGGQVTGGSGAPFGCPNVPGDVNKQLVAKCTGGHAFNIVVSELSRPNGTWTHEVQFLGATAPVVTPYYIECPSDGAQPMGFATQGYFRKFTPPQVTEGWYTRGGTYIIGVFLLAFAAGWLFLFGSVQWNDFQDPKTTGASDDDQRTDSEDEGEESSSEEETESETDTESESGSEYEGDGRSEAGRSAVTSRSGYSGATTVTEYTEAGSSYMDGEEESKAGAPAFHCPNCGEGVHDPAATFCSNCGEPVSMPR